MKRLMSAINRFINRSQIRAIERRVRRGGRQAVKAGDVDRYNDDLRTVMTATLAHCAKRYPDAYRKVVLEGGTDENKVWAERVDRYRYLTATTEPSPNFLPDHL